MPSQRAGVSVFSARCTVANAKPRLVSPCARQTSSARDAMASRCCSTTSNITSPVRITPARTPSAERFATAASVGANSSVDTWSVRTRLVSSGIARSKDRRPASTWATGMSSLAAASAPARVELVSPYTITIDGLVSTSTCSIASSILPVCAPWDAEPICRLTSGAGMFRPSKNAADIA